MGSEQSFVRGHGEVIGISDFGKSASASQMFEVCGITVTRLIETAKNYLKIDQEVDQILFQ